jgi:hypothetical protein
MPSAFFNNFDPHPFSWNPSRDEQDTSFVAAYGVASVGKVCKFNINAHVHLGGHPTTLPVADARPIFPAFLYLSMLITT